MMKVSDEMFTKVLVANRGEIAVQIIRALHDMQISAVAVYSQADRESLFVKLADEAVCIGGPQPADSYLNMTQIISTAKLLGCQAIHPGYGFLSENATFARLCQQCQITFIGPNADLIDLMGDKAHARAAMQANQVPVIPGSDGVLDSADQAVQIAQEIGYPVLLKSAAGGGGKGIREVQTAAELPAAFEQVQQEAKLSYGDAAVYLEKCIGQAKHIEMQVIADNFGEVVYLPERDCSLQRHHQKVIEESPCGMIDAKQRQWLGQTVARATRKLGYTNTGTFEFLMDQDHHFYFIEMNTRLQVEHTITEAVTGIELVKAQIRVAANQPLGFTQADVKLNGYAIECRLNAEDPQHQFAPCPGKITALYLPAGSLGVRIDSGVIAGSVISPYYDAMIAKLIVSSQQRTTALAKMDRILGEMRIEGIKTNRQFLRQLLTQRAVQAGTFTTTFIAEMRQKGDEADVTSEVQNAQSEEP